ncbi:hypothetical protein PENFLA_c085G02823 [Penicillium flavigenum]
MLSLT